ncbi:MAG TPA: hypothetical protein VH419_02310 [Nocardioidaceae bacterium]
MTRSYALPALAAVAALVLAGCGGGGSSEPAAGGPDTSSTPTSTPTSSSTSPGSSSTGSDVVDGVTLTPEGSRLRVGDTARVSWQPNQKTTGVVAMTVTGLLKMPISAFSAWRLNRETRRSTPYFVHATVRNLGKSDLSHVPVPLYLLDQRQTLLQASTFQATFTPCPSRPLPAKFRHGDKTSVCLVYFVPHHGKLVAVSFRPTQDFDAITWQGDVVNRGHHKKH